MGGPLTKIRVADFGWIWAGAWIGQYLSFLGAEVVKIESRRHPDLVRRGLLVPNNEPDETMDRSGAFAFANRGNRHRAMAPHGNYRCRGEDEWVSIAVGTDEEWWGLVAALGEPRWAAQYDDGYRRLQCQDELDELLGLSPEEIEKHRQAGALE